MSTEPRDDVPTPEGEEVGDISSGHGNPTPARISDEKAEQMLTHEQVSDTVEDEAVKVVERPADSAGPTTGGHGGSGASSW